MKEIFEVWGVKSRGKLSLSNGTPTMFNSIERAQECLRFYYGGNGEVVPLRSRLARLTKRFVRN